jgi:hypothetical protein
MISSVLSHDERDELVNGARANVGLIADTIWTPLDQDDSYRKLNRTLWIRVSGSALLAFPSVVLLLVVVVVFFSFPFLPPSLSSQSHGRALPYRGDFPDSLAP